MSSQPAVFNQCSFPCLHSPASSSHSLSFSPASHHILHAVLCPPPQKVSHITSGHSLWIKLQKPPRPSLPSLGHQLVAAWPDSEGTNEAGPKERHETERGRRNSGRGRQKPNLRKPNFKKPNLKKPNKKRPSNFYKLATPMPGPTRTRCSPWSGLVSLSSLSPRLQPHPVAMITNTGWNLRLPRRTGKWKLSVHLQPNGRLAATVGIKMGRTGTNNAPPGQTWRRKRF